MAACVRAWEETDLVTACDRVIAPTLVITGEESLDRVVPVASSLDYLSLISGATHTKFDRTGHLGLVLRPREFAALVTDFVGSNAPAGRWNGANADRRTVDCEPHADRTGRSA